MPRRAIAISCMSLVSDRKSNLVFLTLFEINFEVWAVPVHSLKIPTSGFTGPLYSSYVMCMRLSMISGLPLNCPLFGEAVVLSQFLLSPSGLILSSFSHASSNSGALHFITSRPVPYNCLEEFFAATSEVPMRFQCGPEVCGYADSVLDNVFPSPFVGNISFVSTSYLQISQIWMVCHNPECILPNINWSLPEVGWQELGKMRKAVNGLSVEKSLLQMSGKSVTEFSHLLLDL